MSVDKPYIRPIVRGKETKNVEFGAKSNNIMVDDISFIEHVSFDAFNEGTRLKQSVFLHQRLMKTRVKSLAAARGEAGPSHCAPARRPPYARLKLNFRKA